MPGGRRRGESGTREAILAAAREAFGTAGYGATSLRAVARAAGVDPALVVHFFGSKDGPFEAAVELPVDPAVVVAALLAGGREGLGERLVRTFLDVWDGTPGQGTMLALLRSAVSHDDAARALRDLVLRLVLRPLLAGIEADQPDLRASLLASQVIGLAMARYVLGFEPVASASAQQLGSDLRPDLRAVPHGSAGPHGLTRAHREGAAECPADERSSHVRRRVAPVAVAVRQRGGLHELAQRPVQEHQCRAPTGAGTRPSRRSAPGRGTARRARPCRTAGTARRRPRSARRARPG